MFCLALCHMQGGRNLLALPLFRVVQILQVFQELLSRIAHTVKIIKNKKNQAIKPIIAFQIFC